MSIADSTHESSTPTTKPAVTPLLRAVLLCDLVDSTALIERLGDSRALAVWQRHDELLLNTLAATQGRLIDKADGLLALFERPVQAVDFALRYQRGLHLLGVELGQPLQARVGIHVGDVMTWANSAQAVLAGAKPLEVEGLAKPVAARLMALALPGQILMTGMAQSLALRAKAELGEDADKARWLVHGRYRFKGLPTPMIVHEVGEPGLAPLKQPPSGQKGWREVPLWRRPPVLALELLLAGALVVSVFWSTFRSPPALAFSERDWVVVADLQNLTGDTRFNDSLDTALRLGLEQSRFVNQISELQVQETLARMQRSGSRVDRQLGVEIAQREGARALLLPTLAEIGGNLRISLEVVDPNSGVTVYSETSVGHAAADVLPAIDDVLVRVRGRFGESVASIAKTSKPLAEVTTGNLEALRAFSLARQARNESRNEEAMALYQRAVQLDPDFALAYMHMGWIAFSGNKTSDMYRYLSIAQTKRARLSDREALLLDASHAVFSTPDVASRRWKLLATMYPDEYRAFYNYSYFSAYDSQKYQAALDFIGPATVPLNPAAPSAYYLIGVLNLSLDRVHPALAAFEQADSLGVRGFNREYAEAYAVLRLYPNATRILASLGAKGDRQEEFEQRLGEISFPLDQGQWSQAQEAVSTLLPLAENLEPLTSWTYRGIGLLLRSYDPDTEFRADLRSYLHKQKAQLGEGNILDRRHLQFEILAAGWMAANTGDVVAARDALATVGEMAKTSGYPANSDMALLVQAELDVAAGRPEAAIAALRTRVGQGDELYFLHAVLMRAYSRNKQFALALQQADWLATHRGRAYAEFNSLSMWQPANIIESNLALSAAARYAGQLGQSSLAKKNQAAFAAAWPGGEKLAATKRRAAER